MWNGFRRAAWTRPSCLVAVVAVLLWAGSYFFYFFWTGGGGPPWKAVTALEGGIIVVLDNANMDYTPHVSAGRLHENWAVVHYREMVAQHSLGLGFAGKPFGSDRPEGSTPKWGFVRIPLWIGVVPPLAYAILRPRRARAGGFPIEPPPQETSKTS
jgi:hypothetical protein